MTITPGSRIWVSYRNAAGELVTDVCEVTEGVDCEWVRPALTGVAREIGAHAWPITRLDDFVWGPIDAI